MIKSILITIISLLLVNSSLAQEETDGSKLLQRIKTLEKTLAVVEKEQYEKQKLDYNNLYTNITTAIELNKQLNEVYFFIKGDVETASVYNKLAQVNNPTSNTLGFNFTQIILSTVQEVFNSPDIPEPTKRKFFGVIEKIVNNPIISDLSSNIPILGMARSVVTAASTFFSKPNVSLTVEKKSGKLKNVSINEVNQTEILSENIEEFIDEITPYINFYEQLEYSNIEFDLSVKNLNRKYENLPVLLTEFSGLLLTDLDINKPTVTGQRNDLDKLFNYTASSQDGFSFYSIISNEHIMKANNRSKQIGIIVFELENYYSEYVTIVQDKLKKNIIILKKAKELDGSSEAGIDQIIADIQYLIDGGFVNKFDGKVSEIKTLRRKLNF